MSRAGTSGVARIIDEAIGRAVLERREIDLVTARLLAVELATMLVPSAALLAFARDGLMHDDLVAELLRLDVRGSMEPDVLLRWICWLAAYVGAARRSVGDGDALWAYLSLHNEGPADDRHREFSGAYVGSFTSEADLARFDDHLQFDVVPLFGRFHVFVRQELVT